MRGWILMTQCLRNFERAADTFERRREHYYWHGLGPEEVQEQLGFAQYRLTKIHIAEFPLGSPINIVTDDYGRLVARLFGSAMKRCHCQMQTYDTSAGLWLFSCSHVGSVHSLQHVTRCYIAQHIYQVLCAVPHESPVS